MLKQKMKRIVFLSGTVVLREGGEFSLLDMIKRMKEEYRILCVCKDKGPLADILKTYGVELLFCDLKWSRKFKYFIHQQIRLFYLYLKLRKFSPDLIYSNSGRVNPFAVRLAKSLRVPLITHVRDLFDRVAKDKYLFGQSTTVIACSQVVAGLIKKYNQNIKVIYNGVDPEKFSPNLKSAQDNFRKRQNLDGYFLVGNIGTIAYRKGYFEFTEVAREVAKIIPKTKFLVIGETLPGKNYILEELKKKVAAYNLEDRFIFTGFVEAVEEIIANLDVLLFPPRYEAFGRVIIEAFACSVPVISTYSGGPQELIENNKDGLLCKIGDTDEMAKAVVTLYKDRELYARIRENAYKKFLEKFTIDRTVGEIKSVIDEIISQN